MASNGTQEATSVGGLNPAGRVGFHFSHDFGERFSSTKLASIDKFLLVQSEAGRMSELEDSCKSLHDVLEPPRENQPPKRPWSAPRVILPTGLGCTGKLFPNFPFDNHTLTASTGSGPS
jgi:hypothetical protein